MDNALVEALRALAADPDAPLLGHADPNSDLVPPVWIWLRSGCADLAADLHRRFGGRLDLKVGLLPFPPGPAAQDVPAPASLPGVPSWLTVQPGEPVLISAGRDSSTIAIRLSNSSAHQAHIQTADAAVGHIVDPATGLIVGGPAGAMRLLARMYELPARGSIDLPAIFGPASLRPDWGYQLPAGDWLGCVDFSFRVGVLDGSRTEVRSPTFQVRIR